MLESYKMNCFPLNRAVRVTIHLPKDYYHNERFYPAIYFLDGQNLYEDIESYRKCYHLKNIIHELAQEDKEAIYIGIWAASNEERRNLEYLSHELADFILTAIHSFLKERYRLNSYIYAVGAAKAAHMALNMCDHPSIKGVILLAPELTLEQIEAHTYNEKKLYYFYSGDELNGECLNTVEKLKEKFLNSHIQFDKNKQHDEEGWQQGLIKALNYLVL